MGLSFPSAHLLKIRSGVIQTIKTKSNDVKRRNNHELECLIESHDPAAHDINILPFAPMWPTAEPDFITASWRLQTGNWRLCVQQVEVTIVLLLYSEIWTINVGVRIYFI